MNVIKRTMIAALLALSALGLTTSQSASAEYINNEIVFYCTGCHNGFTVHEVNFGGGQKICPQRTATEWTDTINRMNGKGCGVPAALIPDMANYLAGLMPPITCYNGSGDVFTTWSGEAACPAGSLPFPPPACPVGSYAAAVNGAWVCTQYTTSSTSVTTTTLPPSIICYWPDGTSFVSYSVSTHGSPYCPVGASSLPPPTCSTGLPVLLPTLSWECPTTSSSTTTTTSSDTTASSTTTTSAPPNCIGYWAGNVWICNTVIPTTTTSSTTDTTVTTVATTTSTTLCNTYVNGTTQYPYSGKGSCHGHPDDGSSSGHVVRDQKWCRKHMTHFNSSGNHTHAYPHPMCM